MRRYDLHQGEDPDDAEMMPCSNGDYVEYDDYADLLTKYNSLLDVLKAMEVNAKDAIYEAEKR